MLFFSIFVLLTMVTSAQSAENEELDFVFRPKPTVTITYYIDAGDSKTIQAQLKDGNYTEIIGVQWLCGAITGTGDTCCCVRANCRDGRTQTTHAKEARRILDKLDAIQQQREAALRKAAQTSQKKAGEQKK